MSLHAQLSPQAKAWFESQRRKSAISSVLVALLFIAALGLTLALILIQPLLDESATIIVYRSGSDRPRDLETRKIANRLQPSPAAPSSSFAKVIAARASSPVAVPVPEVDLPDAAMDFGYGDDFGAGWGTGGTGPGGGFGEIPATMRKRCSPEDRRQRLLETGGTPKCEQAVVKGLDWLQRTQAPDGSWGEANKSAMTGFALLAFLGHCETPLSEKYGDTVLRGLTYLVNLGMQNHGKLVPQGGEAANHWPYQHAIATYALAEATTFAKQLGITVPQLPEVTGQAGQFIIDNQHQSGGWDYGYSESSDRGGDLSVTAWQIQASCTTAPASTS